MEKIRVEDLALLLDAEIINNQRKEIGPDVVIDSRLATAGSLFFAFSGQRVDGHDYVAAAYAAGAQAAVVTREVDSQITQFKVADIELSLQRLAKSIVKHSSAQVIGITGSVGKTSTKDLMAQVLSASGTVVSPVGSFNNEIGLPLTATKIVRNTDYFIAEMGADRFGDIAKLCDIAPPDIGVITNVAKAHTQWFKDLAGVAKEKQVLAELAKSWVVLNADEALVWEMRSNTNAKIASYSLSGKVSSDLSLWAENINFDDLGRPDFSLCTDSEQVSVKLPFIGVHQVSNALAVAATAIILGIPLTQIKSQLEKATIRSKLRMELLAGENEILIVNDCYNANPKSLAASLQAVMQMESSGRRKIAVLGEMAELGKDSELEHQRIGILAKDLGFDEIITVGEMAQNYNIGFGSGYSTADCKEAARIIEKMIQPRDLILIKGSRSMQLEKLAPALLGKIETEDR